MNSRSRSPDEFNQLFAEVFIELKDGSVTPKLQGSPGSPARRNRRVGKDPSLQAGYLEEGRRGLPFNTWTVRGGLYRPAGQVVKRIPAGVYATGVDQEGWFLGPIDFKSDELLRLPGLPIDYILGQIETFWGRAARFAECGLLHKRGIMLYGPAGCGKTSVIKLLSDDIVQRDGIVMLMAPMNFQMLIFSMIRQIEPDRPILTVIEDLETFMGDPDQGRSVLAFLDGESQVNHIVHLATTNKPEDLEDTVIRRPGRFDVVVELKAPVREAREAYLRRLVKTGMSEDRVKELVDKTEGLSLAHLRELVAASHCLDMDLTETLDRLKGNMKKRPRIGASEKGVGFSVHFQGSDNGSE